MGIKVSWDDQQQTIACFTFHGPWTWEELQLARREQHALLNSVDHTVDVIMDFQHSGILPQNPIAHLNRLTTERPVNTGLIVLVGANAFVETMARLYRRMYGPDLMFDVAVTLDGARQKIATHRAR